LQAERSHALLLRLLLLSGLLLQLLLRLCHCRDYAGRHLCSARGRPTGSYCQAALTWLLRWRLRHWQGQGLRRPLLHLLLPHRLVAAWRCALMVAGHLPPCCLC
jgi:hypothetical protein